eukprot:3693198-Alexandrium_andersonii.AAC.1
MNSSTHGDGQEIPPQPILGSGAPDPPGQERKDHKTKVAPDTQPGDSAKDPPSGSVNVCPSVRLYVPSVR